MATKRAGGRPRNNETDDDVLARAAAQFPDELAPGAWAEALTNPHMHGSVLADLVKVAVPRTEAQRRGIRPMPDAATTRNVLDDVTGNGYCMDPFPTAFDQLAGRHSLAGVEARTGVNKFTVRRLRNGTRQPTLADMEAIAKGYHRTPFFFAEYRRAVLLSLLAANITPEQSANLIDRIQRTLR